MGVGDCQFLKREFVELFVQEGAWNGRLRALDAMMPSRRSTRLIVATDALSILVTDCRVGQR